VVIVLDICIVFSKKHCLKALVVKLEAYILTCFILHGYSTD